MARLRVALRVPVGRPLPDIAGFVARCEDAGFDGVGIHDHPSSGRDAYLALALAARATHRLRRARLACSQPGGNRAGTRMSHRGARFHFDAEYRATPRAGGCHA